MSLRTDIIRVVNELLANSKKISELPPGSTPAGSELIEGVQGGVNVKFNISQIATGGAGVLSVVAGTNVTVDNTDPQNPIVSATGGGSFTLTDGEGTTASGTAVDLGGAVTGASVVDIGLAGAVIFQANAVGALSLGIGSSGIILDTGDTSLSFASDTTVIFTDDRAAPLGIQYAADYSATLTARSLVDLGTVTALISAYTLSAVLTSGNNAGAQSITNLSALTLANNGVIDVPASGGSDVLNIGTGTAEVINIGRTGATVNIIGTTVYENVTELQVSDKLITINKGGSVASATGTGFEIEENSSITGYFKTSAARTGYDLKAPATAGIATFVTDASSRTYTLPAGTGTLALTSDLTAYAPLASPTFTGVPLAPTAAQGTNTTQIATTAFVVTEIAAKAWLAASGVTMTANNTISGAFKLTYSNSVTAAAGTGYGIEENPTVVAAANADVLRGVSINPVFTNGAFTTVTNSAVAIISGLTASSGTTTFNSLRLAPVFNTTSTYSGIGRGFYFVPTLTSTTGLTLYSFLCTDGAFSFTNNFANLNTVTGTWTATANSQAHCIFTGTFTSRATAADTLTGYSFTPSFAAGSTSQNIAAVRINPTWTTTNSPNNVCLWITVGSGDTGALPLYIETTAGARLFQFNGAASLAIGSTGTASIGAQTNGSNSATGRGPILATTVSSSNTVGFMLAQNSTNINGLSGTNKWIRAAAFTYNPTNNTGSPTLSVFEMSPTINQTSTATGPITYFELKPVLTSVLGTSTIFVYDPSVTTVSGTEYGFLINRGCLHSFNAGLTPTNAFVSIGAGTTALAPLKLISGTNLTTAVNGCFEYNGTNLFFTRTGAVRENVICESAVNVVSPTAPNRTITINIDGTTYYLHAKTTND